MTSYLDHNSISIRETFPESLVTIRLDDVILRHVTSPEIGLRPKKAYKCIFSHVSHVLSKRETKKHNMYYLKEYLICTTKKCNYKGIVIK